jgi:hypothetical protein
MVFFWKLVVRRHVNPIKAYVSWKMDEVILFWIWKYHKHKITMATLSESRTIESENYGSFHLILGTRSSNFISVNETFCGVTLLSL